MTRLIKWYKRASFWSKIVPIVAIFTGGSEFALWFAGAHPFFHWFVGFAGVIYLVLKYISKDENNNNIIDIAE